MLFFYYKGVVHSFSIGTTIEFLYLPVFNALTELFAVRTKGFIDFLLSKVTEKLLGLLIVQTNADDVLTPLFKAFKVNLYKYYKSE